MTVSRAAGARDGGADAEADALDLLYTPGCGATDHVVFWGVTPFTGALSWSGSACSLGTSGTASIDPGNVAPGAAVYFVVVAQTAAAESSYGQDSAGSERPEAIGIGACDRPRDLTGVCP